MGKVVLITGGSQGYGKASAKAFSDSGAKVIIAARNEAALASALKETGSDSYICMDVTRPGDWEAAQRKVMQRYGRLDVLINNAGGGVAIEKLCAQTPEEIQKSISLNLLSVIYGSRAFTQTLMDQKSGTIINVASVCAKHAWPGWSVYSAAKWGVLGFSKNLDVELRPYGIRVTCLIPGAGATDFMQHAGKERMNTRLEAADVAKVMVDISQMPAHVVVEEITVWGIDQTVVPL